MNPFESVTIHSFRRLRNVQLANLRKVNVLVGENNAAKTSCLEAVALLSRPMDADVWVELAIKREPPQTGEAPLDPLKWMFPHSQESGHQKWGPVELSCEGKAPVKWLGAEYFEEKTLRHQWGITAGEGMRGVGYSEANSSQVPRKHGILRLKARTKEGESLVAEREFWEPALTVSEEEPEPRVPMEFVAAHDHRLTGLVAKKLIGAERDGRLDEARALASQLDPEVIRVTFGQFSVRPGLYVETKRTGVAPLSTFGDATRRSILIAILLPLARDGILLLDEVETSLYKTAFQPVLGRVLDAARQLNIQVFLSTHSLETVDSILSAAPDEDVAVFRLDETKEHEIEVTRTAGKTVRVQREERGFDIR